MPWPREGPHEWQPSDRQVPKMGLLKALVNEMLLVHLGYAEAARS